MLLPRSLRLDAVLALLRPCALLADVGTDHGYVPALAVQRGLATRAVAADLRAAPLVSARQNIARAGVGDCVEVLQGDGILALAPRPVDALVMAGMSGKLMATLADAAPQVLSGVQQLIVQPNKDVAVVRAWALRSGWHLRDERMVHERGRFFVVCAFEHGTGADPAYARADFSEAALCAVGPRLLAEKDALLQRVCDEQIARLRQLVAKAPELADELNVWERARAFMR